MRSRLAVVMAAVFNFWRFAGDIMAYMPLCIYFTDGSPAQHGFPHGTMVFSMLLAAIIWNLGTGHFKVAGVQFPMPSLAPYRHRFNQCVLTGLRQWWMRSCRKLSIFSVLIISPIVGLVTGGLISCCAATGAVLRNAPYPPDASRT